MAGPTGLVTDPITFPRQLGKDQGLHLVEVAPGDQRRMTEEEWQELLEPGGGAAFRLEQAVEIMRKALAAVPRHAALAALEDLVEENEARPIEEETAEVVPLEDMKIADLVGMANALGGEFKVVGSKKADLIAFLREKAPADPPK